MNLSIFSVSLLLVVAIQPLSIHADWPQYRGRSASGLETNQPLPTTWNIETGENIRWHTKIPGLAHSSPIISGNRIYVATAVAQQEAELKVGLYGDIDSANDNGIQEWHLLALDQATGNVLWNSLGVSAIPRVKRHTKASHCNSTPATDGKHIVSLFGSEGMYCFDTQGKLLWKKDLGPMDSGYFDAKSAQWGFASSPVIHDGKVVVQCDVQEGSFIAVYSIQDGRELWRTPRTDVPTWSTPTVVPTQDRTQIVVNGWHESAGYDFTTGKKLWTLDGGGDIPVPTPIVAHQLIYLTSAHGKWRPMRAIRPTAMGDITPADPGSTNEFIAWAHGRQGNYMQTPLVVGDLLFACNDMGILTCFDARSGKIHFSERLSRSGQGFTASPVSDGKHLYFPSEVGNIFVVAAESKLRIVGIRPLPEPCMATPAINDGTLYFRTQHRLIAIGKTGRAEGLKISAQTIAGAEPPQVALKKPDSLLIGNWEGALQVGDNKLRALFVIQDADNTMKGTMTSLDQGNAKVDLSRVGMNEGVIHLEMDEIAARFAGRLNESKDKLQGEWQQLKMVVPLTLKKQAPGK